MNFLFLMQWTSLFGHKTQSNAGRNNSQDNYAMVGESDSTLQSSDAEDEPLSYAKGSSFRR